MPLLAPAPATRLARRTPRAQTAGATQLTRCVGCRRFRPRRPRRVPAPPTETALPRVRAVAAIHLHQHAAADSAHATPASTPSLHQPAPTLIPAEPRLPSTQVPRPTARNSPSEEIPRFATQPTVAAAVPITSSATPPYTLAVAWRSRTRLLAPSVARLRQGGSCGEMSPVLGRTMHRITTSCTRTRGRPTTLA